MGGCQSNPEDEIYEYPRRRHRPMTPVVYTRSRPRTFIRQPMIYPERRYPMPPPVIDGPVYGYGGGGGYGGGYRRYEDDFDDYDFYDRGRGRYSYHSYTR